MDLSEVSLKAVLLHNRNKFPSFPLAYAVHVKETYRNLQVGGESTMKNTGGIYVLT
jgi:hypothetical protein